MQLPRRHSRPNLDAFADAFANLFLFAAVATIIVMMTLAITDPGFFDGTILDEATVKILK